MNLTNVLTEQEFEGSPQEKLKAVNMLIARLEVLRADLTNQVPGSVERTELHGPYLHAPVWPWFLAGWAVGAVFVLLFVFAWANS